MSSVVVDYIIITLSLKQFLLVGLDPRVARMESALWPEPVNSGLCPEFRAEPNVLDFVNDSLR